MYIFDFRRTPLSTNLFLLCVQSVIKAFFLFPFDLFLGFAIGFRRPMTIMVDILFITFLCFLDDATYNLID